MKLAISNIAWSEDYNYYYQQMTDYGFKGLEIAPTKFSDNPYDNLDIIKDVRKDLFSKYNLDIVSMQSLLFGTQDLHLFQTADSRDSLMSYLKKAIIYANACGSNVLVFGNPKNRVYNDYKTDYLVAIEFFRELGEFAKTYSTHLCIEPNPKEYGTNFINTLEEAYSLVNDVASDGFKMIVDSSTMLINNDKPELINKVLSNVCHIHLSMPYLKPLNIEYTNYQDWILEFISVIKNSNYSNYLSIEMANVEKNNIVQSIELLSKIIHS